MGYDSRVNPDYKRLKAEARTNKLIYNQCEPCEERRERKKKEKKSDTLNNNVIEDALLHEGGGRARIFLRRHRSLALGVLYLHYTLLMSYLLPDKVCLSIFLYRKNNPWNKLSCLRDFVHSMAWEGTKMNMYTSTYYYFLREGGRRESGTCRKYSTVQVKIF